MSDSKFLEELSKPECDELVRGLVSLTLGKSWKTIFSAFSFFMAMEFRHHHIDGGDETVKELCNLLGDLMYKSYLSAVLVKRDDPRIKDALYAFDSKGE